MKLSKEVLYNALLKLRPGLAKKEIIEQATHFIFTGKEIATYNDRICITYPFETDFKCSVKGEEFFKLISGTTEDSINITLKDDQLNIGTKRIKAGLSTLVNETDKVEEFIEKIKKDRKKVEWKKLPEDFTQGAFFCMFSASKEIMKGPFTCIFVSDDDIYSTDGLRASHYKMKSKVEKNFLVRAKDVAELVKFEVTEFSMTDNWIHYRTKDDIGFNCRHILEDYPYPKKVKTLFEINSGIPVVLPDTLKPTVDTVAVLAEGDVDINKTILVEIIKDEIKCTAERERGWVEKSVETKYDGPKISFFINPIFLSQVLARTTTFMISAEEHKALFKTDNFTHVIALPMED
jgi:uncharacterized protein YbaR (Trm112 family)